MSHSLVFEPVDHAVYSQILNCSSFENQICLLRFWLIQLESFERPSHTAETRLQQDVLLVKNTDATTTTNTTTTTYNNDYWQLQQQR